MFWIFFFPANFDDWLFFFICPEEGACLFHSKQSFKPFTVVSCNWNNNFALLFSPFTVTFCPTSCFWPSPFAGCPIQPPTVLELEQMDFAGPEFQSVLGMSSLLRHSSVGEHMTEDSDGTLFIWFKGWCKNKTNFHAWQSSSPIIMFIFIALEQCFSIILWLSAPPSWTIGTTLHIILSLLIL